MKGEEDAHLGGDLEISVDVCHDLMFVSFNLVNANIAVGIPRPSRVIESCRVLRE